MKEKFGSFILFAYLCTQKIKNKPRAAFLDRGWTDQTGSLWIRIQLASVWESITRGSTNGKPHKKNKNYGRNEFRWRNGNCCHQS